MDLYIYDENIELIGVIDSFISLIWTDRYSCAGYFELYVPATDKNVWLLQRFHYVHRPEIGVKNVMYINGIRTTWSRDNGKCLIVTGYTADGLLRKRILTTKGNGATLLSVLQEKLIATPIENVEISSDRSLDISATVYDWEHVLNAEDWAYNVIKKSGKDVSLNSYLDQEKGKVIIGLRKGEDKSDMLRFSEEFGNISSSDYSFSEEGCGNVVIAVTKQPTTGWAPELPVYIYGDKEETGARRTEIAIEVEPVMKEVTTEGGVIQQLDYSATMAQLMYLAPSALRPYSESFSAEAAINGGYREKWKTGDKATVIDEARGTTYLKRIEEVREVYDRNGFHIYPTFGESIKTIFDLVKGR